MGTEKPKINETETTSTNKKKGIIGRNTNKDCKKRKKLCRKLINENHAMSKEFFIKEYTHLLEVNGLAVPKVPTLVNDAKKCGISFSRGTSVSSDYTIFNYLGSLLSPDIRQIRLTSKKGDRILLDVDTYSFRINTIKTKVKKISNTLESSSFLPTNVIYLSFILKESGLEEYIKHTFDTHLSDPKEFLYIEVCCYCVKIYFEYMNYDTIMGKVFEIIELLEPYE